MLTAAHPRSVRGRLEAYGYTFAPSFRRGRLRVTRDGVPVGHLDRDEAGQLLDAIVQGQHDAHCAESRARAEAAALDALARAADAAEFRR